MRTPIARLSWVVGSTIWLLTVTSPAISFTCIMPLENTGQYYKMDDREIRTYMGQPDPNDDFNGQASSISLMHDQHGHHSISTTNREYTIMKSYTARWYWQVTGL